MYNASDATKIPLREKPKNKVGRPKKGEKRELPLFVFF